MKKVLFLLLAVANLIHCQDHDTSTLQEVLEKLEGINDKMRDMQKKLSHLEDNIQELSREMGQCVRGAELEHLSNVSAAAHQEIYSFVHDEISGVKSLAERDECLEGRQVCGSLGICQDTIFSFTCSCPSGFAWNGSECADIDECSEVEGTCSPNAICMNSIGNYSCSCNKPFEGDGRTSCEILCQKPAKVIKGLGCIRPLEQRMTSFQKNRDACQEEGGRLLQHFNEQQLTDLKIAFDLPDYSFYMIYAQELIRIWAGVYDEKWMSDESLVQENLWTEGYESDPSKRCGALVYEASSSFKVTQEDCSLMLYAVCQFLLP